jgi:hypothetical protein
MVCLTPSQVGASPDTLRGALTNVVGAPFDVVLSPVIGAQRTRENRGVGANRRQRTAWSFFGFFGQTGLQVLTGAARLTTGALQLVPGVLLFPFPGTDLPDHLDPFGTGEGMIDLENPLGSSVVRWVPLVTPLTIDLKVGVRSQVGDFRDPDLEHYPGTVPAAEMEEPRVEMSTEPAPASEPVPEAASPSGAGQTDAPE